jgi:hypothetical protein
LKKPVSAKESRKILTDEFLGMMSQTNQVLSPKRQDEKHKAVLKHENLFDSYVKCYASNKKHPKFVTKRTAKGVYLNLVLERQKTKVPDWERNLAINQKLTDQQKYAIKEVLEEAEITAELVVQAIESVAQLSDDVFTLNH